MFSAEAWSRIGSVYGAILEHPFNRELAQGTLATERFALYLIQDTHYLEAFSRALALAAARAPSVEERLFLTDACRESVAIEDEMHRSLLVRLGVDPGTVAQTPKTPACAHYVDFLLRLAAWEPYELQLAGLLPCFWIYWEVGMEVRRRQVTPNPYQAWIDTYAGEEYGQVVRRWIEWTDRRAAEASGPLRTRMFEEFGTASRLEWRFWDSAYREEVWIPGAR